MFKVSLAIVLTFFCCAIVSAQQTVNTDNMMSFAGENTEVMEVASKSFYADADNQTFFIDFQSLNVNLNAIVVKDASGAVVLDEKVFDLPVDTIYELDLSKFKSGRYKVELQSFSKVIQKSITLR